MSNLAEITSLFAKLASNLQALDPTASNEDQDLNLTISNLNRSLNLTETPRVTALDTALSLMCFTAPQVYDMMIEYTVKTIVTVLSSSIECNALRIGKDEVLRVGGSISLQDCVGLIEACAEILDKLEMRGGNLCSSLLCAVIKVAVSTSNFRYALDITPVLDEKSSHGSSACSKLLQHLRKESDVNVGELPLSIQLLSPAHDLNLMSNTSHAIFQLFIKEKLTVYPADGAFRFCHIPCVSRLLYWYLDPHVLKHDISQILQEATERPFLCLSMEFYERTDWRFTITCLSLSPSMFIETRAMLHNWFLIMGVASVLKLQTELVSLVLDVSSRPMWWGLSMEIGSKLPFSHSFFPDNHQLLRILAGPLSCESFQHLVQIISKSVSLAGRYTTSRQATVNIAMVDHTSMWSMTMNFPDWFHFASVLLLCNETFQDSFLLQCAVESAETDKSHHTKLNCYSAAARFIAWILNPSGEFHQNLLVDYLAKVSESLTLKCKSNEATSRYCKNVNLDVVENMSLWRYNFQTLYLWLQEFQDMCITCCRHVYNSASEAEAPQGIGNQQSMLLRRIPLGIMIGHSSYMDEEGCELLLHYAATGTIFQLAETQHGRLKHRKWNCTRQQDSIGWTEQYTTKEAVAGACVVFDLTDLTESMSASIFESEESGLNFLCQVKLKAGKYLFKCIKRLLQLKIDEDVGFLMLRDLCKRTVRWRRQGQDVFRGYQDLDDIIDALNHLSTTL